MKKYYLYLLCYSFFSVSILFVARSVFAENLSDKLKGRILLQAESRGEAWYVNPDNLKRYYLGRPDDAFKVMRELGLGITNKNFDSFNGVAPKRLSGKILIKVEDGGKAYYVNPANLRMKFLGKPADAFKVMREAGMGISNNDLNKIMESGIKKSSLSNLELDIRTPKNIYKVGESLQEAEYYLKYSGKSFNGLIIYGESREGLVETSYSFTKGIIQTGDFDHPETMPGMKTSIYSIKSDGTPNSLDCDGVYKYTISVYDCAAVDRIMGTNDCGAGGWPPTIDKKDVVAKVLPLKSKSKNIPVICDNNVNNCCSNSAYSCSKDENCLSGYSCANNKCIKK